MKDSTHSPNNGEAREGNNDSTIMKQNSSTSIILPPEQNRESRRQKLNEILQRTRQENQSQQSAGATGELASTKEVGKFTTSYATGISNPLPIANIDKTALAKVLTYIYFAQLQISFIQIEHLKLRRNFRRGDEVPSFGYPHLIPMILILISLSNEMHRAKQLI